MNILFIISQSLSVFIPSFTDEFNALDVCYILFLVDERKNYTTQTQQIISYIEKYSFDRLLIINDLNKDAALYNFYAASEVDEASLHKA